MIRSYVNEKWKEFDPGYKLVFRYAISNFGRLLSFTKKMEEGRLLKGGTVRDYKVFRYKTFKGKKIVTKHIFLHKLVAQKFIPNRAVKKVYVLHLDHHKSNNVVKNLQWATREEMIEHSKKSPAVIKAKKKLAEFNRKRDGHKLNETKVRLIRNKLADPNRRTRLKMIAKQFGVSEMTLHRIRTGENWSHVK